MKYLILLSLIFSISFADYTLTEEEMEALHLKIEQCKLYQTENTVLNQKATICDSMLVDQANVIKLQEEQLKKMEEINEDLLKSTKGKWYESPYFVGIIALLLGNQLGK